jgi:hypothetical protein
MESPDEEDALVLGHKDHLSKNSYMVQLNYKGKEALLRSGVLIPRCESLRLLQRKDRSMVMALAGVQAFGYIWSLHKHFVNIIEKLKMTRKYTWS